MAEFYVYEHWRLDRNECFYVGKGKQRRAYTRRGRNSRWQNIVAKLERIGSGYEVRLIATGLTEQEALEIERARVALWREKDQLANLTDGGGGVSGWTHSEETRAKMAASKLGKKQSPETVAKRRPKLAGVNKGRVPTKEQRERQAAALRGRKYSDAHRQNISAGLKGRKKSAEHRAKLSAVMKGNTNKAGTKHKPKWAAGVIVGQEKHLPPPQ